MARRIGIKQDSMLYKARVTIHSDGKSSLYHESGPYETRGVAAQVASCMVNHCTGWAKRRAQNLGTEPDTYTYEVIKGRMVWFEEGK